ncbi:MAG: hotdog fold thioesterase [Actinobacteria bacterium]|nr:hotdog fold thioesterase [Actinomycetota bacterium]
MSGFDRVRVEEMLAADPYAANLGVVVDTVTEDQIVVSMEVTDRHLNFLGVSHGGAVFSLADCAFSLASNSAGRALAIDTHLVLTAASRHGDRLQATVRELSRGGTLGTYRAEVTRQDGRLVGLFTGTVHISGDS